MSQQNQLPKESNAAEQALSAYDQNGEQDLIRVLGQLAHPAQRHETWRDAGVCILEDGTAVIQERHYYEFRWARPDGKPTATQRPARLTAEQRRFRWFYHGPLQSWPAGENIWQDIDEILTERALATIEQQDVIINHVTVGGQSGIPVVTLMQACPQLGALVDAAAVAAGDALAAFARAVRHSDVIFASRADEWPVAFEAANGLAQTAQAALDAEKEFCRPARWE